jgi:hypothetical protein
MSYPVGLANSNFVGKASWRDAKEGWTHPIARVESAKKLGRGLRPRVAVWIADFGLKRRTVSVNANRLGQGERQQAATSTHRVPSRFDP